MARIQQMRPPAFKLIPRDFVENQDFCQKSGKITEFSILPFGKKCSQTSSDCYDQTRIDRALCFFTGPQRTNSNLQTHS